MIRFSCADYAFPLLPRAKRFALLGLLGFEHVDIGLFERSPDLAPREFAANPGSFTKRLKSELRSANLRVSDVFLQTGLEPSIAAANDTNAEVRSRNRKVFQLALDLCAALDCAHLTGLPGVRHQKIKESDDFAMARDEAAWRQQTSSETGVTYAIEPHIGSLCQDVTSARAFLAAVPGLTLTLDYGHFVARNIRSRDVHSLLTFASHIHARGGAPNQLQARVGENKIDFDGIVRRLRNQNYRGFLAVEYVWTDWQQCNRTDNVSETILLRRYLEEIGKKG